MIIRRHSSIGLVTSSKHVSIYLIRGWGKMISEAQFGKVPSIFHNASQCHHTIRNLVAWSRWADFRMRLFCPRYTQAWQSHCSSYQKVSDGFPQNPLRASLLLLSWFSSWWPNPALTLDFQGQQLCKCSVHRSSPEPPLTALMTIFSATTTTTTGHILRKKPPILHNCPNFFKRNSIFQVEFVN